MIPANKPFGRLDANEGPLFEKSLEYITNKVLEEKLQPLSYQRFIPITSELPKGARSMTYRRAKGYARAKIIADYARDFPSVAMSGTEHTENAFDIGVSYNWSIEEIRSAIYAGINLEASKIRYARRAIEEKFDQVAWNGETSKNIKGFIKYPGTTEYTVPATGTGATKTWSTKTAAQILTDLNGMKQAVYLATNGVESIDTLLIPPVQLELIKNLPIGTASDTTVYEFFVRNNPGITLAECFRLDGAGTAGADVMMGYKNNSEYVRFEIPMAFETIPPQQVGMEFIVHAKARCMPVQVYYNLAVVWGEGI
jgi:hypothetical protein